MRKSRKLKVLSLILAVATCLGLVLPACSFASEGEQVAKPQPVAKVQSVTLQYNNENINGVFSAELSQGTLQLNAAVVKDEAADGTVAFKSSESAVATINASGLVTLLSGGETVISAAAGSKKHEVVLSVIAESGAQSEKYDITVTGGVSSAAQASAGEIVTLTPEIPADKEFKGWQWDENIYTVYGNAFVMPACAVEITAQFVNRLESITVISQPDDNRMVKGGAFNTDGLKIMAKSVLGGEEWDVTKDCTFSEYTGGDKITAYYTLGDVTRTTDIAVEAFTGYTVDPLSLKAEYNQKPLIAIPEDLYDGSIDKYKETGLVGGMGTSTKYSMQNNTFAVSNVGADTVVTYCFWSDFTGNAHINLNVASSASYSTSSNSSSTPDAVYEVLLKEKYQISLNGAQANPANINPKAKANAYETPNHVGDWIVCAQFAETYVGDMLVERGWNTVSFKYSGSQGAVNFGALSVEFSGKDLVEFVSDIKMDLRTAQTLVSLPEDMDAELGSTSTGAIYLEKDPSVTGNSAMKIGDENGTYGVTNMKTNENIYYYFYSEGNGTADIVLNAASSTTTGEKVNNYNSAVYAVVLNQRYTFTLNGTKIDVADDVISPAQKLDNPANNWIVGQQFVDITVCRAKITKGWNVFVIGCFNHSTKITPAGLNIKFVYDI